MPPAFHCQLSQALPELPSLPVTNRRRTTDWKKEDKRPPQRILLVDEKRLQGWTFPSSQH
eukprot:scaffold8371_cov199-Amphora_coffeaeformis.AAC.14